MTTCFKFTNKQQLEETVKYAPWANEKCIIVDYEDHIVGESSKEECHLRSNIEKHGTLHRAFSVFLFDSSLKKSRLLLQQRALIKATFAGCYTNACCSHPLVNWGSDEMEEAYHIGVKRAAKRRLQQELGMNFPLERLYLLKKVHYQAIDYKSINMMYGEHEMDYVLLGIIDKNYSSYVANPEEVRWSGWVTKTEVQNILKNSNIQVTPWFKFICNKWLFEWWEQLDNLPELEVKYNNLIYQAGTLYCV